MMFVQFESINHSYYDGTFWVYDIKMAATTGEVKTLIVKTKNKKQKGAKTSYPCNNMRAIPLLLHATANLSLLRNIKCPIIALKTA